jgi:predicted kinase
LPGTGKSTLARGLADRGDFRAISSDVVRKELAGVGGKECRSPFGQGIYTAEWTKRTYAECLRRAEELLFNGERVLVDANFREESQRQAFLTTARSWGVPAAFLLCQTAPNLVWTRLANRGADVSDADWSVYEKAAETWEELRPETRLRLHIINTEEALEVVLGKTLTALRQLGVSD